jgi:hypothetical protein
LVVYPDQAIVYLGTSNSLISATNAIPHTPDVFGNNWRIGNDEDGDPGRTFNGTIDEVAVFASSLPPTRIAAYYQAATQGGVQVTNIGLTPTTLQFTSINAVDDQVILQWLGLGTLQETTNLAGPWLISPYQHNPVVAPISGNRFYRLQQ